MKAASWISTGMMNHRKGKVSQWSIWQSLWQLLNLQIFLWHCPIASVKMSDSIHDMRLQMSVMKGVDVKPSRWSVSSSYLLEPTDLRSPIGDKNRIHKMH
eukprot:scaffold155_cov347-Pavlova_lutheri.AAC.46